MLRFCLTQNIYVHCIQPIIILGIHSVVVLSLLLLLLHRGGGMERLDLKK